MLVDHQEKSCMRLTFHEIPSDSSLRDQWLKAISRDDWVPTSNPVVCSLHFRTSDFRVDCKKRLLKPGAGPSVFDEQTSSTEDAEAAKQGYERTRKRKRECSPLIASERGKL
ncbi:hypothetical protein MTO96_016020 [Rhipicephalus appendiculatus]